MDDIDRMSPDATQKSYIFADKDHVVRFSKERSHLHKWFRSLEHRSWWPRLNSTIRTAILIFGLSFVLLHPETRFFIKHASSYTAAIPMIFGSTLGSTIRSTYYFALGSTMSLLVAGIITQIADGDNLLTPILLGVCLWLGHWALGPSVHILELKIYLCYLGVFTVSGFLNPVGIWQYLFEVWISYLFLYGCTLAVYLFPKPHTTSANMMIIGHRIISSTSRLFYIANKGFLTQATAHSYLSASQTSAHPDSIIQPHTMKANATIQGLQTAADALNNQKHKANDMYLNTNITMIPPTNDAPRSTLDPNFISPSSITTTSSGSSASGSSAVHTHLGDGPKPPPSLPPEYVSIPLGDGGDSADMEGDVDDIPAFTEGYVTECMILIEQIEAGLAELTELLPALTWESTIYRVLINIFCCGRRFSGKDTLRVDMNEDLLYLNTTASKYANTNTTSSTTRNVFNRDQPNLTTPSFCSPRQLLLAPYSPESAQAFIQEMSYVLSNCRGMVKSLHDIGKFTSSGVILHKLYGSNLEEFMLNVASELRDLCTNMINKNSQLIKIDTMFLHHMFDPKYAQLNNTKQAKYTDLVTNETIDVPIARPGPLHSSFSRIAYKTYLNKIHNGEILPEIVLTDLPLAQQQQLIQQQYANAAAYQQHAAAGSAHQARSKMHYAQSENDMRQKILSPIISPPPDDQTPQVLTPDDRVSGKALGVVDVNASGTACVHDEEDDAMRPIHSLPSPESLFVKLPVPKAVESVSIRDLNLNVDSPKTQEQKKILKQHQHQQQKPQQKPQHNTTTSSTQHQAAGQFRLEYAACECDAQVPYGLDCICVDNLEFVPGTYARMLHGCYKLWKRFSAVRHHIFFADHLQLQANTQNTLNVKSTILRSTSRNNLKRNNSSQLNLQRSNSTSIVKLKNSKTNQSTYSPTPSQANTIMTMHEEKFSLLFGISELLAISHFFFCYDRFLTRFCNKIMPIITPHMYPIQSVASTMPTELIMPDDAFSPSAFRSMQESASQYEAKVAMESNLPAPYPSGLMSPTMTLPPPRVKSPALTINTLIPLPQEDDNLDHHDDHDHDHDHDPDNYAHPVLSETGFVASNISIADVQHLITKTQPNVSLDHNTIVMDSELDEVDDKSSGVYNLPPKPLPSAPNVPDHHIPLSISIDSASSELKTADIVTTTGSIAGGSAHGGEGVAVTSPDPKAQLANITSSLYDPSFLSPNTNLEMSNFSSTNESEAFLLKDQEIREVDRSGGGTGKKPYLFKGYPIMSISVPSKTPAYFTPPALLTLSNLSVFIPWLVLHLYNIYKEFRNPTWTTANVAGSMMIHPKYGRIVPKKTADAPTTKQSEINFAYRCKSVYHVLLKPTADDIVRYKMITKRFIALMLASFLTFIPDLKSNRAYWAILTVGAIFSDNSGASLRSITHRIQGTMLGAFIGYISVIIHQSILRAQNSYNNAGEYVETDLSVGIVSLFLAVVTAPLAFFKHHTHGNYMCMVALLSSLLVGLGVGSSIDVSELFVLRRIIMTLYGCCCVAVVSFVVWPTTAFSTALVSISRLMRNTMTVIELNFAFHKLASLSNNQVSLELYGPSILPASASSERTQIKSGNTLSLTGNTAKSLQKSLLQYKNETKSTSPIALDQLGTNRQIQNDTDIIVKSNNLFHPTSMLRVLFKTVFPHLKLPLDETDALEKYNSNVSATLAKLRSMIAVQHSLVADSSYEEAYTGGINSELLTNIVHKQQHLLRVVSRLHECVYLQQSLIKKLPQVTKIDKANHILEMNTVVDQKPIYFNTIYAAQQTNLLHASLDRRYSEHSMNLGLPSNIIAGEPVHTPIEVNKEQTNSDVKANIALTLQITKEFAFLSEMVFKSVKSLIYMLHERIDIHTIHTTCGLPIAVYDRVLPYRDKETNQLQENHVTYASCYSFRSKLRKRVIVRNIEDEQEQEELIQLEEARDRKYERKNFTRYMVDNQNVKSKQRYTRNIWNTQQRSIRKLCLSVNRIVRTYEKMCKKRIKDTSEGRVALYPSLFLVIEHAFMTALQSLSSTLVQLGLAVHALSFVDKK